MCPIIPVTQRNELYFIKKYKEAKKIIQQFIFIFSTYKVCKNFFKMNIYNIQILKILSKGNILREFYEKNIISENNNLIIY